MRSLLVSALALGAFTSAAVAGPVVLTGTPRWTPSRPESANPNSSTVSVSQTSSVTLGDVILSGVSITQTGTSSVTVTQSNSVAPPPE